MLLLDVYDYERWRDPFGGSTTLSVCSPIGNDGIGEDLVENLQVNGLARTTYELNGYLPGSKSGFHRVTALS